MSTSTQEPSRPALRFGASGQQVLVTGATGFIGQLLVRALLADGQQVTVLARQPQRAAALFDGRVRAVAHMDELPSSYVIDVVVNLAGARILGPRWSVARRQTLLKSRVGLTEGLVHWIGAAQRKPRLMLSASAIGYYGVQPQGDQRALDEDSAPQQIFMSTLCQQWENAAAAAAAHGVQVCRMRFGLVLGRGGALPMMLLPVKLGLGGPLGGGRQSLSWIHVDDLLRAIAHLWQSDSATLAGPWNFTAPEVPSQAEFSRCAARLLGRPCFMPTPGWPMRLLLGEQADLLLEGQRVAPARLLADGFTFTYPGLEAALRSLL